MEKIKYKVTEKGYKHYEVKSNNSNRLMSKTKNINKINKSSIYTFISRSKF